MRRSINIAVFCCREKLETIADTISFAIRAAPEATDIDVLVNGNKEIANTLTKNLNFFGDRARKIKVWSIPVADKGNAWNQHIHRIWNGECDTVYIDGNIRIRQTDIDGLCITMAASKSALGSSAVPTVGWSKKAQRRNSIKNGGYDGRFCALKSEALIKLRDGRINIPLGMYRVDSILGAYLSFNLDCSKYTWDPHQYIPVSFGSSWSVKKKFNFTWRDIYSWHKRKERQAKGDLENAAVKYFLTELRVLPSDLPTNVRDIFLAWREAKPDDVIALIRRGQLHRKAVESIVNYKLPSKEQTLPQLVGSL